MEETEKTREPSQPDRVVTPRGGLLMPFLWEIDKRLRRTFAEARHPVEGLITCATELHSVRAPTFVGKCVLVACDLVQASSADRVLLLQVIHALVAHGALVELHLTAPHTDPAYMTPPQQRARALLHFLAPEQAQVIIGAGRLDIALSRCDYLLWAHNVIDNCLPRDLKPTETFASWVRGLGIDMGLAHRGVFTRGALARIREHAPHGLPSNYVVLGQDTPSDETKRQLLHVAEVARLTAAQRQIAVIALRDHPEAQPLDRVLFPGEQPLHLLQPRGLTSEQILAVVLGAEAGFGLPGYLLHLGSLLGRPWYLSHDTTRPFSNWELGHYNPTKLLKLPS